MKHSTEYMRQRANEIHHRWELHADMMNAADEYKSPAALSAVECELISINNENVWFNMIIMIDMHVQWKSADKLKEYESWATSWLAMSQLGVATRKHFVVFFGVPLEFSALSLFRVFDWAAKSPIHSYYTSNGFTCCCSIFSSLFLEYYKQ